MPNERLGVNRVHDPQRNLVELSGMRCGNEHEELLAAPAHDHVGLAQGLAQSLRDRHEDAVAGRVAVAVVDLLEVIEVEQDQRLDQLPAGAAPLFLATSVADEILEIAPVVERGQRIAAALKRKLAVLVAE